MLRFSGLLTGFFIVFCLNTKAQDTIRPNVLLIISRGHGVQDLGCYGNVTVKTPHLDELAKHSVQMMNFFCSSACGDANMAALFTGMYSHANGQYGPAGGYNHFSVFPEIQTLPFYFKTAGYRTVSSGKSGLQETNLPAFDTILGMRIMERSIIEQVEQCSGVINAKTSHPFFLCFSIADPDRGNEWVEDDSLKADLFGNRPEGYEGVLPKHYEPSKIKLPYFLPESNACKSEMSAYYQSISRMDLGIGRLLYWVKKSGNWDNTLIIYLSSDVPAFPGVRNTMYDPGIRIPCLIKLPAPASFVSKSYRYATHTDMLPTILDICRIPQPNSHVHGKSLRNELNDPASNDNDDIFVSQIFTDLTSYYPMRMVRNHQYKLIWNCAWQMPFPLSNSIKNSATWRAISKNNQNGVGGKTYLTQHPQFELYNMLADPSETINLALSSENGKILEEMKLRLKNFMIETSDPWITVWENK